MYQKEKHQKCSDKWAFKFQKTSREWWPIIVDPISDDKIIGYLPMIPNKKTGKIIKNYRKDYSKNQSELWVMVDNIE